LVRRGSGPYFYLPKMQSHLEARLWNSVFHWSQSRIGIPLGTVRATVLIETILAAFEMDEILWELRDHSAGLNCGRWDYIFSYIKSFRNHPECVLPDRSAITMTVPFMDAYVCLLIQTCHRRGVHAMGGMSAAIPVKDNKELNRKAFENVERDKIREVTMGCDGTWVAHPGLIDVAMKIFDENMPTPNQISLSPSTNRVITARELLPVGLDSTVISENGLTDNIEVGLMYLEAWLRGIGCIPYHNLMEDAATAEIARCQVWQWVRHAARLSNGRTITAEMVSDILDQKIQAERTALGEHYNSRKFELADHIYRRLLLSPELADFLTLAAYPHIVTTPATRASM